MARLGRVRDRESFAALRRAGARRRVGPLSVTRLDPSAGGAAAPVAAFAIGRAVGTAVARNRLRRRLRAILRDLDPAPGTYLIAAGPAAATLPYQDLRRLIETGVA